MSRNKRGRSFIYYAVIHLLDSRSLYHSFSDNVQRDDFKAIKWGFFSIDNYGNIYLLIGLLSKIFYVYHLPGNLTRISLLEVFLTLVLR